MDASQRWETEALRTGSQFRKTPPTPPAEEETPEPEPLDTDANWVTLKEAEAATGIPLNTLRKWSRKSAIPSYLESDGELKLRMVDLDAVIAHAHDLGREVNPLPEVEETEDVEETVDVEPITDEEPEDDATNGAVDETDTEDESEDLSESSDDIEAPMPPEGTLIVPLDAWNKMLNQLGNLHEAGQQLAEATERAAKAETEAKFLRERLAEMRAESTEKSRQPSAVSPKQESRAQGTEHREEPSAVTLQPEEEDAEGDEHVESTTSYWRYLTFGWRDRKRRNSKD